MTSIGRPGRLHLIEVLAAFAIASVIIVATAVLVRDVALHFDRGTRRCERAERFMLAVERLPPIGLGPLRSLAEPKPARPLHSAGETGERRQARESRFCRRRGRCVGAAG